MSYTNDFLSILILLNIAPLQKLVEPCFGLCLCISPLLLFCLSFVTKVEQFISHGTFWYLLPVAGNLKLGR
jgi:hypothetical protein